MDAEHVNQHHVQNQGLVAGVGGSDAAVGGAEEAVNRRSRPVSSGSHGCKRVSLDALRGSKAELSEGSRGGWGPRTSSSSSSGSRTLEEYVLRDRSVATTTTAIVANTRTAATTTTTLRLPQPL